MYICIEREMYNNYICQVHLLLKQGMQGEHDPVGTFAASNNTTTNNNNYYYYYYYNNDSSDDNNNNYDI